MCLLCQGGQTSSALHSTTHSLNCPFNCKLCSSFKCCCNTLAALIRCENATSWWWSWMRLGANCTALHCTALNFTLHSVLTALSAHCPVWWPDHTLLYLTDGQTWAIVYCTVLVRWCQFWDILCCTILTRKLPESAILYCTVLARWWPDWVAKEWLQNRSWRNRGPGSGGSTCSVTCTICSVFQLFQGYAFVQVLCSCLSVVGTITIYIPFTFCHCWSLGHLVTWSLGHAIILSKYSWNFDLLFYYLSCHNIMTIARCVFLIHIHSSEEISDDQNVRQEVSQIYKYLQRGYCRNQSCCHKPHN